MEAVDLRARIMWVSNLLNCKIGFTVTHMMFTNVRGYFKEFDAEIYTAGEDFMRAEIILRVNPASISTGDKRRDAHLKECDFFDIEHFKEIKFTACGFVDFKRMCSYELTGQLSMKGIQKQIKLMVDSKGITKDIFGNDRVRVIVKGKINRGDWGLAWNKILDTGGVLICEEVCICCEMELVAAKFHESGAAYLY